jgi:hypothetical protein
VYRDSHCFRLDNPAHGVHGSHGVLPVHVYVQAGLVPWSFLQTLDPRSDEETLLKGIDKGKNKINFAQIHMNVTIGKKKNCFGIATFIMQKM